MNPTFPQRLMHTVRGGEVGGEELVQALNLRFNTTQQALIYGTHTHTEPFTVFH